jgi:BirA family transcriptional regulator, biotin operon repressor / biotin---[acetyl-CoA-carboxylase] ligase
MKPRTEWRLPTRRLGQRVLVFERLDSTNNHAALLAADPANGGVAILADEQTAGRGQHGRTWTCSASRGVLLSVLLFPPPELLQPALLTAWAAVSVCETIRQLTGLQARIKWPNDVHIDGRKVCGILIERRQGTVAGIGLNVNQTAAELDQAALPLATSLALCGGRTFERDEVAHLLIAQLDAEYDRLCQGDLATLETSWKGRLGLHGKQVTAECHDAVHHGRLLELGWDGVALETAGGMLRLRPELVQHLTEASHRIF